jgi:hydrophobic/amphiphilic exporter-1 (mainly G- bacteria), HAE1 family
MLEMQRVAAELQRTQPRGTSVNVTTTDTSAISSFAMIVHVLGGENEDRDVVHDLAEELVTPRFAAVSGVSQVLTTGGAPRQVQIAVDPDRTAALGLTTEGVIQSVRRNVNRLQYVGTLDSGAGRIPVVLDGRPRGLASLAEARVRGDRQARLRHVTEMREGAGREESRFRVNGLPAVGVVMFREEGTNLVRLGRDLRARADDVREELRPLGLDIVVGFDGAALVEDQIARLARLGLSGFAIALVVLFLFLREWRAVAVVGIAVPVSLLAALAMLYLAGQSLNLITLFGLALAVGLLVDNSVVVYEAVQRRLERGAGRRLPSRRACGAQSVRLSPPAPRRRSFSFRPHSSTSTTR